MKIYSFLLYFILINQLVYTQFKDNQWFYPKFQFNNITEEYYDKKISDPYRDLENIKDSIVQEWFAEQNNYFNSIISCISGRDSLKSEMEKYLYSYAVGDGMVRAAGDRIFFVRYYFNNMVSKLFYCDENGENLIEIFSTEQVNDEQNIYSIDYFEPSYNSNFLVIGISSNGDEKTIIHIIDVNKKIFKSEKIDRVSMGNPQWLKDNSGFFYSQSIDTILNKEESSLYEWPKVKLHILNSEVQKDLEVFSGEINKELLLEKYDFPDLFVYPSSNYAIVELIQGNGVYASLFSSDYIKLINTPDKIKWKEICSSSDKVKSHTVLNDFLIMLSFKDNNNGNIVIINLKTDEKEEINLNEKEYILNDIISTNTAVFITVTKNGYHELLKLDIEKHTYKNVPLPFNGTIDLRPYFSIAPYYLNCDRLFFGIETWNKKWGIYSLDNKTLEFKKTSLCPSGKYGSPEDIIVADVMVPSYDSAMVPLTIIYKRGIRFDGSAPLLMEAYGAYSISIFPYFSSSSLVWFNKGGIIAKVHVRGGGEKGDTWYAGGFKETKPNSWKDLIACCEFLIHEKYTSPDKLALEGASAGGIPVGMAVVNRPDLIKTALLDVPLVNPLRLEFSANKSQIAEFGTINDSLEFKYLMQMDMYHHINDTVNYPSMLFITGMNDRRVAPWQPGKAVARLQQNNGQKNIILFKVNREGHFGSNDISSEIADKYTFLLWQLNHPEFKYMK